MSKHVVSLSERFVDKITLAIKEDLKTETNPILDFKVIYDDDRRIYKISVKDKDNFYVLKIRGIRVVKQQDNDLSDLQNEYDLLKTAWDSAQNLAATYSMSKPIKLWLEQKAMLLSGCEGENLNDYFNQNIFKWLYSNQNLRNRIYKCGYWLGNYHLIATKKENIQEFVDVRKSHLDRMLKVLAKRSNHNLKNECMDSVIAKFASLTNKANNTVDYLGQIHGNFAYRNVLINESMTNLVDFEDARMDYVGYDTGQFIAEIILKSQFPWLRSLSKSLCNEFKSGYEKHLKLDPDLTRAYVGYHLVVHLYEHCTRSQPQFPKSLIHNFRIKYLTQQTKKWVKHSN